MTQWPCPIAAPLHHWHALGEVLRWPSNARAQPALDWHLTGAAVPVHQCSCLCHSSNRFCNADTPNGTLGCLMVNNAGPAEECFTGATPVQDCTLSHAGMRHTVRKQFCWKGIVRHNRLYMIILIMDTSITNLHIFASDQDIRSI